MNNADLIWFGKTLTRLVEATERIADALEEKRSTDIVEAYHKEMERRAEQERRST